MESSSINVEMVMARIREDVRRQLLNQSSPADQKWVPKSSEMSNSSSPIIFSEDLRYLNENWRTWYQEIPITSHRRGIGQIIIFFKTLVVETIRKYVLGKYFERERDFQHYLVRFLNNSAKYVDKRDSEIFQQLLMKIDHDVRLLQQRTDSCIEELRSEKLALADEIRRLREELEARRI